MAAESASVNEQAAHMFEELVEAFCVWRKEAGGAACDAPVATLRSLSATCRRHVNRHLVTRAWFCGQESNEWCTRVGQDAHEALTHAPSGMPRLDTLLVCFSDRLRSEHGVEMAAGSGPPSDEFSWVSCERVLPSERGSCLLLLQRLPKLLRAYAHVRRLMLGPVAFLLAPESALLASEDAPLSHDVKDLEHLEYLDLSPLTDLTSLQELALGFGWAHTDLPHLPDLKLLHVHFVWRDQPAWLERSLVPGLTQLVLTGDLCQLAGSWLAALPQLKHLELVQNPDGDVPRVSVLQDFSWLRCLQLLTSLTLTTFNCPMHHGCLERELHHLTNLERLDVTAVISDGWDDEDGEAGEQANVQGPGEDGEAEQQQGQAWWEEDGEVGEQGHVQGAGEDGQAEQQQGQAWWEEDSEAGEQANVQGAGEDGQAEQQQAQAWWVELGQAGEQANVQGPGADGEAEQQQGQAEWEDEFSLSFASATLPSLRECTYYAPDVDTIYISPTHPDAWRNVSSLSVTVSTLVIVHLLHSLTELRFSGDELQCDVALLPSLGTLCISVDAAATLSAATTLTKLTLWFFDLGDVPPPWDLQPPPLACSLGCLELSTNVSAGETRPVLEAPPCCLWWAQDQLATTCPLLSELRVRLASIHTRNMSSEGAVKWPHAEVLTLEDSCVCTGTDGSDASTLLLRSQPRLQQLIVLRGGMKGLAAEPALHCLQHLELSAVDELESVALLEHASSLQSLLVTECRELLGLRVPGQACTRVVVRDCPSLQRVVVVGAAPVLHTVEVMRCSDLSRVCVEGPASALTSLKVEGCSSTCAMQIGTKD